MSSRNFILFFVVIAVSAGLAQAPKRKSSARPSVPSKTIDLPTSKALMEPVPGSPQKLNSFPANLAVSPDGRYVAILNAGYGTEVAKFGQSIALLDRQQNRVTDYADPRVARRSNQIYFYGIAFSGDGSKLYVPIGSLTDPLGSEKGDTGNGIAVYAVRDGTLEPERFLPIAMRKLDASKMLAAGIATSQHPRNLGFDVAPAAPAGIAVIKSDSGEKLLVANNVSDDAVLLDAASGKELQRIDLSTGRDVPGAYPYAVVASRDGQRAWISLWNGSAIAEIDVAAGKVSRRIAVAAPSKPTDAGSHPTALLLTADERRL